MTAPSLTFTVTDNGSTTRVNEVSDATGLDFTLSTTHSQSIVAEEWCKELESRTGGKVKVNYFPGQTLVKAPQLYDAVVEGIADISFGVLAYHRGRFPVMAAIDLPLGYTSGVVATKITNDVYAKFKPKSFDDVQVMYFHGHGPGLPHTAKKPIVKLEDWKGMKLRATGNSAKIVTALGGTPVAASMNEAYQSIQKGVVDGGMYPIDTNKGFKLGEVVDFCTEAFPIAYTTAFYVVMNKDKWASLDAETQKIITDMNVEYAAKHGQTWTDSDVIGRQFLIDQGGKCLPLAEGEAPRWVEAVQPVIDDYIKEVGEVGLDGKTIVDYIKTQLESLQ
ncbi:MAG: TRAP transporter substrate-binding protein [Proteobacteria bacterium]|nr:TRAP transporter substrate-binding protein [Pseudomonadota bacterium]